MTGMRDGEPGAAATQVLIADQITHIVEHLEKLADFSDLVQVCGVAREPGEVIHETRLRNPDVVLLGADLAAGGTAELAREVKAASPGVRILTLTDVEGGHGTARANGNHAVHAHASGAELVAAIRTAHEPRSATEAAQVAAATRPGTEPIRDVLPRPPRATGQTRGEVFVVHSGKGGVGKSVLASNLAVALAVEARSRVALVDLDLQHGDSGVMLHIDTHAKTIEDLAGNGVTQETLHDVMATGPEGVRVLLAPVSPDRAAHISRATVRGVLEELRRTYDHIVVDTPAHLDDIVLDAIQDADALLLVTTFNVTTVKSARSTLRLLRTLGVAGDRIALILNQMRPKMSVARAEIEDVLRYRMLTQLAYEPWVDEAVDTGRPLVLGHPRSPLSRQLGDIVRYLVPSSTPLAPGPAQKDARQHHPAPLRRLGLSRRWLRTNT